MRFVEKYNSSEKGRRRDFELGSATLSEERELEPGRPVRRARPRGSAGLGASARSPGLAAGRAAPAERRGARGGSGGPRGRAAREEANLGKAEEWRGE